MHGNVCCSPERETASPANSARHVWERVNSGVTDGMRLIPGGESLMGNDRDYGFPADGEGPVHRVALAPFWIDACAVTNEQFNAFVHATGFKTDSERFGWSFVFQGHLSPGDQAAAPRLVVQGVEWWCRVEGATWRHPEGPASGIKQRWQHPVVHVSWNDALAYA